MTRISHAWCIKALYLCYSPVIPHDAAWNTMTPTNSWCLDTFFIQSEFPYSPIKMIYFYFHLSFDFILTVSELFHEMHLIYLGCFHVGLVLQWIGLFRLFLPSYWNARRIFFFGTIYWVLFYSFQWPEFINLLFRVKIIWIDKEWLQLFSFYRSSNHLFNCYFLKYRTVYLWLLPICL